MNTFRTTPNGAHCAIRSARRPRIAHQGASQTGGISRQPPFLALWRPACYLIRQLHTPLLRRPRVASRSKGLFKPSRGCFGRDSFIDFHATSCDEMPESRHTMARLVNWVRN